MSLNLVGAIREMTLDNNHKIPFCKVCGCLNKIQPILWRVRPQEVERTEVCVCAGGGVSLLPYPVLWCFADNLRSPKHMVAFRDWDRHSDPSLSLPSLTIFRFVSASFLAHSLA